MDPLGPDPLIRSFERHLYAENRSARTVTTYLIAVRQADTFLRQRGASLEAATRGDLEAFLGDLLSRRKASTAATHHKVLKILYGWLAEEEEIPANPMAKIKKPIVPEQPVPIVSEEALKRLFAACAGNTFEGRRDAALLMLLLDTAPAGPRWSGSSSPTSTWSSTSSWSSARAAERASCRSAAGPARRWTATCGRAPTTSTPSCRGYG
jgi:site-specific recombinase XerC